MCFGRLFLRLKTMKPTLEQFKKHSKTHNVIPVYAELLADTETPVLAFSKIAERDDAFLLESAESASEYGRYSFIGFEPKAVFTVGEDRSELKFKDGRKFVSENKSALLDPLKNYLKTRSAAELEGLPNFFGGAVGYMSYEVVNLFERLPAPKNKTPFGFARLGIFDELAIFDNVRHTIKIVVCAHADEFESGEKAYEYACSRIESLVKILKESPAKIPACQNSKPIRLVSNMAKDDYLDMVEKAKEYIRQGEIIQVVLSQEFSSDAPVDAISAYRALRFINPSPYMFCFKSGGNALVGSSPETLVRFANGRVFTSPIAGTRRRGKNEAEDIALADELLSDEKERAEHLMLVDLGRNDISRVCESGSVQVNEFMSIRRYSHVMHLVSHVEGAAKKGVDAFDILAATFPAGTLSGAPEVRAMQIINELEPSARGAYGGCVGYIGYNSQMDMAITIRTLQITGGRLAVRAGGGIVYDSVAEAEYEETRSKSRAVARAIEAASRLTLDVELFS